MAGVLAGQAGEGTGGHEAEAADRHAECGPPVHTGLRQGVGVLHGPHDDVQRQDRGVRHGVLHRLQFGRLRGLRSLIRGRGRHDHHGAVVAVGSAGLGGGVLVAHVRHGVVRVFLCNDRGSVVAVGGVGVVQRAVIAGTLGGAGEGLFKEGVIRLQPENDFMDPIIVQDVVILGRVIGVMRFFK